MGGKRSLPQCPIACNNCRVKKARCSGEYPCTSCTRHEWECVFPSSDQQRQRHSKRKVSDVEDRLARLETLLREQSAAPVPAPPPGAENIAAMLTPSMDSIADESRTIPPSATFGLPQDATANSNPAFDGRTRQNPSNQTHLPQLPGLADVSDCTSLWNDSGQTLTLDVDIPASPARGAPGERGTQALEEVNSEHHGNASYLGICSRLGVDWISQRIGSNDFVASAHKFTAVVNRTLKLRRAPSSIRVEEPDDATAEKWITAYFEDAFEHRLGLVQRGNFESKRQSSKPNASSDPGWYALRNIVYAIGSRIYLAADQLPSTYVVARDTSWGYFENALSVHTELLYMRTDSTAVEALLLMAFFAEGISSPALEFLLLSSAVRLAQSKGFHLPVTTTASEEEKENRSWLWWCLYLFDKILTTRACRPSCIHDEDFDLALPTTPRSQTLASMEFFKSAVQHARISALVSRRLYSTRALSVPIVELLKTTNDLDKQIRQWWAQLPAAFRSRPTSKLFRDNPQVDQTQWTYIYFAFHGTLCAIHSVITYPWVQPKSDPVQQQKTMTQVEHSSRVVANASRAIASMTQQTEVNAASHVWQVFYYPMVSHINLFLQILQAPRCPSAESDLALMEVVAGSISRIEYATNGDLKFSFAREITNIARTVLFSAKESMSDTLPSLGLPSNELSQELLYQNASYLEDASNFINWETSEWAFQFPALGGIGLIT